MAEASPRRYRFRLQRLTRRKRQILIVLGLLAVVGLVAGAFLLVPFWQLTDRFADAPVYQPSRLYGRPTLLVRGDGVDLKAVAAELDAMGYRVDGGTGALPAARYRRGPRGLAVTLRRFPTLQGMGGGKLLEMAVENGRIAQLRLSGEDVPIAMLEPPVIASYYGETVEERRPVRLEEVPESVVQCVLAAEDAGFFRHLGISFKGTARALLRNVQGGAVRQGGSTLTQQLVKNFYRDELAADRSLKRKAPEAVLAVLLELRYSKKEILQAYLNEIYLGASGGASIIGVGAAARAYFGKDLADLDLLESATIAGMIPSPGNYSPLAHPDRARERRDWVLDRLAELEIHSPEEMAAAKAQPLLTSAEVVVKRRAPYFGGLAAAEAKQRFGLGDLADAGYTLLSTLSWTDQKAAEEAVSWGVKALESGWEQGNRVEGPLQVALVSVDPRDGGILAYIGGRDFASSQFDRASQAARQAGSSFKPVVYAAAFEAGTATPSTLLEDAPLTVTQAGRTWSPQNDDDEFIGWVTARTAIEQSRNVPTARLALDTGLDRIVALARKMGVTSPLKAYPSLSLGAFEVSPVELATVYATFASEGKRPTLHALTTVLDASGKAVEGRALAPPERVLSRETSFLVTSLLRGVLDHGTGRRVRELGLNDALAGKTGTTNGRRDSWFAGYAPIRATVVWVGYDDSAKTRMSGSRAALPIWARFMRGVRPAGGYPEARAPGGVVGVIVDPASGGLATETCPETVVEYFRVGEVPTEVCPLHQSFLSGPLEQPNLEGAERPAPQRGGFRRWLQRVFGSDRDEKRPPPPRPPRPPS